MCQLLSSAANQVFLIEFIKESLCTSAVDEGETEERWRRTKKISVPPTFYVMSIRLDIK